MITFRMAKINVTQFAILADEFIGNNLSYSVEIGFKASQRREDHHLACDFTIEFFQSEELLIKLGIMCEFDIHPDDWQKRIIDNELRVSKGDLGFLANQTVGTSRGVLFCKTEGTPFSQLIVPPINLVELIKDDVVFTLNENQ